MVFQSTQHLTKPTVCSLYRWMMVDYNNWK